MRDHTWPQFAAKFLINEFFGILKKHKTTIEKCGLTAEEVSAIFRLVFDGEMTRRFAKEILSGLVEKRKTA